MNLLYPLASLLGIEAGEIAQRLKKNGLLWGAIVLLGLIALGFALLAANAALSLWVGPVWAPLIIAAVAAVIALTIYLVSKVTAEVAHRREVQRRRSAETTALVTTAAVTAIPLLMKSPLLRNIGLPLGGALVVLFLLLRTGRHSHDGDEDS